MTDPEIKLPSIRWNWHDDCTGYDRGVDLTQNETFHIAQMQARIAEGKKGWPRGAALALARILLPLDAALDQLCAASKDKRNRTVRTTAIALLIRAMHRFQMTFWGFTGEQWHSLIGADYYAYIGYHGVTANARHQIIGIGYLLGGFIDLWSIGRLSWYQLAEKVFGAECMDDNLTAVLQSLHSWGFTKTGRSTTVACVMAAAFLKQRSCNLHDLQRALLLDMYEVTHAAQTKRGLITLTYVLTSYGILERPLGRDGYIPSEKKIRHTIAVDGIHPEWLNFGERWFATSPLQRTTRVSTLYRILHVARWDITTHAHVCGPQHWDRKRCVEFTAAVSRWCVGDFARITGLNSKNVGKPLEAATKEGLLRSARAFFHDMFEWEWLPRVFDPRRVLATPRSLRNQIGPDPRVIDDSIWAKLIWAGLNITETDISKGEEGKSINRSGSYPLKLVQAVAAVWLFSGLRRNEITRLRLGCIRWQQPDKSVGNAADVTCMLDVPVNKTNVAFTKPVDQLVGKAIEAWLAVRPPQPPIIDSKTGQSVHLLFAYRNRFLGNSYLNATLVPLLCKKAGVPRTDARAKITSHRARATIASQRYNAKEPLDLFQLQEWLGHRSPESTRHYTKISPTRLAKSYSDAGYFARNLRAIDVLIDRDVIAKNPIPDEPWKFYDLGHGYCSYDFFEQCPHRMACAKCDFYVPKESSAAHLLEGKANLLRLKQEISLNDDERSAIEDGVEAYDKLLVELANKPTPTRHATGDPIAPPGWQLLSRMDKPKT
jgi:integrase